MAKEKEEKYEVAIPKGMQLPALPPEGEALVGDSDIKPEDLKPLRWRLCQGQSEAVIQQKAQVGDIYFDFEDRVLEKEKEHRILVFKQHQSRWPFGMDGVAKIVCGSDDAICSRSGNCGFDASPDHPACQCEGFCDKCLAKEWAFGDKRKPLCNHIYNFMILVPGVGNDGAPVPGLLSFHGINHGNCKEYMRDKTLYQDLQGGWFKRWSWVKTKIVELPKLHAQIEIRFDTERKNDKFVQPSKTWQQWAFHYFNLFKGKTIQADMDEEVDAQEKTTDNGKPLF